MNYTEMLLKKNKNIILILTIYLLLYIILIKYTIVVDKENLYYNLTLNKYILYIFHGFFFILINYIIINNIMIN